MNKGKNILVDGSSQSDSDPPYSTDSDSDRMIFSDEESNDDDEEEDHLMGCIVPAMMMHQMEIEKKLIINSLNEPGVHGGSVPGRYHKQRDRVAGFHRMEKDYFAEHPVHRGRDFRIRCRMSKRLFLRIYDAILHSGNPYFEWKVDGLGVRGLHPKMKMMCGLRILAYGIACDAQDDYLRIGQSTANKCLREFCGVIITLFAKQYLRSPTDADIANILEENGNRGFPGCLGSLDCMHWEWKNCPTSHKGQYTGHHKVASLVLEAVATHDLWIWHAFFGMAGSNNDVNVLHASPLFNQVLAGKSRPCEFQVNGTQYHQGYYLADGIYLSWPTLISSIKIPQTKGEKNFCMRQESVRKDIERVFGVLQQRWHIIRNPATFWDVNVLDMIMKTCIILHNMVVEDERGDHIRDYLEDLPNGPAPPNVNERLNRQAFLQRLKSGMLALRDRSQHDKLKTDLIYHL